MRLQAFRRTTLSKRDSNTGLSRGFKREHWVEISQNFVFSSLSVVLTL